MNGTQVVKQAVDAALKDVHQRMTDLEAATKTGGVSMTLAATRLSTLETKLEALEAKLAAGIKA